MAIKAAKAAAARRTVAMNANGVRKPKTTKTTRAAVAVKVMKATPAAVKVMKATPAAVKVMKATPAAVAGMKARPAAANRAAVADNAAAAAANRAAVEVKAMNANRAAVADNAADRAAHATLRLKAFSRDGLAFEIAKGISMQVDRSKTWGECSYEGDRIAWWIFSDDTGPSYDLQRAACCCV